MKLKTLTLTDIARIGIIMDDPWGDGIRLEQIRNPSPARMAALAEVRGEPFLDGETLIREAYESVARDPGLWTKKGDPVFWLKQRLIELDNT